MGVPLLGVVVLQSEGGTFFLQDDDVFGHYIGVPVSWQLVLDNGACAAHACGDFVPEDGALEDPVAVCAIEAVVDDVLGEWVVVAIFEDGSDIDTEGSAGH